MLTEAELRALMAGGESDRVEMTTSTGNTDKFGKAACAFANDFPQHRKPGHLLVGVDDTGNLSGLTVTDRLLRNLGALSSNVNLEPPVSITIEKHELPGGDVAVVSVLPSDLPPVRYKGTVWIRVGPSRHIAGRQQERILTERRAGANRPFDLQPQTACTLDDLVLDLFRVSYLPQAVSHKVLRENDRDPVEQMASLRFYDLAAGCPTNAAVILFAADPLRWIPGAYLQFVRWNGTSVVDDPINTHSFRGDLLTVLREIGTLAWLPVRARPTPGSMLREDERQDYPATAIRELVLNAVMHRSYESNAPVRINWFDDRIEIQSPGGLYGIASPENFPNQTDYRNPVIAETMATLGYVNRFGRGVLSAQEALRRNGNHKAEFHFEPSFVLATIPGKQ